MTRRYDESEIAEILRRATELDARDEAPSAAASALPAGATRDLTLVQVQEIAAEVGIDAAVVERAARSLDLAATRPPARFLGAPRSVSHTVPLARAMTDGEWHRTVALLREAFGAKGEVETLGPLRTWHNGNLQVHVEPSEDGYRLRMYTYKGNVGELTAAAVIFLVMMVLIGGLIYFKRGIDPGLMVPAMFGLAGGGLLGGTRLSLPRWAAEREAQFEALGERVPRLLATPSVDDAGGTSRDP